MDLYRKRVHTNMTLIRNMIIDIVHASHHLEFLRRAEATGILPRGLTVEPRMMLVFADETTTQEWKEQTKQNTLGYMKVAIRHYDKTITDRTSTISETQTETIQLLNDTRLNERQRKGLKGTYELMLKAASDQAKKIKCERDQSSEKKLSDAPPTKRRRLDEEERYDVHICTHANKIYTSYETTDPGHQGESLVRDPTDLHKKGGETATNRRNRLRSKPDKRRRCRKLCVFKRCNICTSTVTIHNPDNIVNLSSYRLSNRETDILSKGLSFTPYTPYTNQVTSSEIIDFTNKLRLRYKYMHITPSDNPFRLKTKQTTGPTDYKPLEKLIDKITLTLSQIKSTTGRPNLPKDGMRLIHRLKNQHEVIINQADKGSTIVLLDRKTYVEGHKHLADPETYTRLEHDITDKIKQTIETKLDNLYKSGLLTKRQYEFCYPPESHRTSLMYFLIKLHKNPHTYRPICSCVNSIMANISGFLDFWLKQVVVLLPTYIRDTTHLIQTLEKQIFCKDIILCTVDVTNMYTNIPTAEGNQAALRALTTLKKSTPMPDMAVLADLLDIVTKNNVFEFNGEFYLQTRGVPMGNIMAPSYLWVNLNRRSFNLTQTKLNFR